MVDGRNGVQLLGARMDQPTVPEPAIIQSPSRGVTIVGDQQRLSTTVHLMGLGELGRALANAKMK